MISIRRELQLLTDSLTVTKYYRKYSQYKCSRPLHNTTVCTVRSSVDRKRGGFCNRVQLYGPPKMTPCMLLVWYTRVKLYYSIVPYNQVGMPYVIVERNTDCYR